MPSKETGNLAFVYAEALYDAAQGAGALERVEGDLLYVQQVLRKNAHIYHFFESPTVMAEDKRKVILGALSELSPLTHNFLSLLIRKRRVRMLDRIADAFHKHCNEKAGIAEMQLDSARAFEAGEKDRLRVTLEAKWGRKVVLLERVRPDLLGGFILTHQDRQWDTSLIYRLGRLVNKMELTKEALGVWAEH